MNNKINILHISYDLRDRLKRETTTAVKKLINLSNNFADSSVIDLIRVTNLNKEKIECSYYNKIEIDSFGLPYGIFLTKALDRVLNHIISAEQSGCIDLNKINIVHAHKLTYEGYIGYNICKKHKLPLIITLRQTDTMILNRKPFLRKLFRQILAYSDVIFYLNPYSKVLLEKRLGNQFYDSVLKNKMILLPNIVERDLFSPSKTSSTPSDLLTILRMDKRSVKRKNMKRLLIAFSLIKNDKLKLNIIGSGNYLYKIKFWVKKYNLENRVNFLGRIPNADIDKYYSNSLAFLLPSISESFGLVYAESIINGTPILYSKNHLGFDGYFENVGVAVNPMSINSIKTGILNCISNNDVYRNHIKELNSNGAFKIFSSHYIQQIYFSAVTKIFEKAKTTI
jgi:glycosyltransferase involved in cell wall biosynthesis